MDKEKMEGILVLLVPQVIREITLSEGISAMEATNRFYRSELYASMENENTKLWHLSSKALYQLYHEEQTTGEINYPEEA